MFHVALYVVLALAHFAHVFEAVLPHAVAAALPWVVAACYAGLAAIALWERGRRGHRARGGAVEGLLPADGGRVPVAPATWRVGAGETSAATMLIGVV